MNNKKVFIIEYDDNNNEIDRNCIADEKWLFKNYYQFVNRRYLLDKKDREIFNDKQWEIIEYFEGEPIRLYTSMDSDYSCLISNAKLNVDKIEIWKRFFNEPIELQQFVKKIYKQHLWQWHINRPIKDGIPFDDYSFQGCYSWVKSISGIYYSVYNDGTRCWDFIDNKPTYKQAKYQDNKGRRIIFFSFKDWKEYIMNLNEFK
ncbi:hypothetical protein [Clostridium botulinum]|uniref:hypothetical protein n=1 Tax=Clostridium botulinum TaxID=1491 RepID=UPI003890F3BE